MATQDGIVQKRGSKYYVVDPDSGGELPLKGYGSLTWELEMSEAVDWTKPIFEQVVRPKRARKPESSKSTVSAA